MSVMCSAPLSGTHRQHPYLETSRDTCLPECSWDLCRGQHCQRLIQRLTSPRSTCIPQYIDGEILCVEQQYQSIPPTNTIDLLALKRIPTEVDGTVRLQVGAQLPHIEQRVI